MICERVAQHSLAVSSFAAMALLAALGDPAVAAQKSEKKDAYALTTREPGPAVLAVVSLDDQRVTLYDADGPVLSAPVSSGQTDYETPVGIYTILQKNAEHYSNLYDDASMPHMQRITWSGVALHGGALPGYPASHGCVRLPYKFAERIFALTKLGTRVIVARNNVAPVAISHPLLFKRTPYRSEAGLVTKATALVGSMLGQDAPAPAANEPADVAERAAALRVIVVAKTADAEAADKEAEPARALKKEREPDMKRATKALKDAEKAVKRASDWAVQTEKTLSQAKSPKATERAQAAKTKADEKLAEATAKLETVKAEAQPKIDLYQQAADQVAAHEAERDAAKAEARAAERKLSPVKVFISLKTQTLYVRQNFEPIFETPVSISDPNLPIGTHTYTAVDYGANGHHMRWNVISIGRGSPIERSYDDQYYDYEDAYYRPRPRRRASTKSEPTPTDLAAATAALDRITIPEDAVERISELVLPGTSLIVSDEEASKETGQQTEFVVLISGEPQGAIKKRPRRDPYADEYYSDYDDYYNRRARQRPGPLFRWW